MARFLSTEQRTLLDAILDRLIPAQGAMPGAGQAGAADYLDGIVGGTPRLARLFAAGLHSIESAAARRGVAFVDMSGDQQDEILNGIEANKSEFFETLLMHTYNGYYSNPQVVEALGLEPRPPQPRGHDVGFGDFNSLEAVVDRGVAYRKT
jgi:hypothetical protein